LSLIFLLCLGLIVSLPTPEASASRIAFGRTPFASNCGSSFLFSVSIRHHFLHAAIFLFCLACIFNVPSCERATEAISRLFTFVGALIAAIALNYRAILQLVTGK